MAFYGSLYQKKRYQTKTKGENLTKKHYLNLIKKRVDNFDDDVMMMMIFNREMMREGRKRIIYNLYSTKLKFAVKNTPK